MDMTYCKLFLPFLISSLMLVNASAQEAKDSTQSDSAQLDTLPPQPVPTASIDYSDKKEYEIGEVKVTGANFSDGNAIRVVSGLKKGKKIKVPGDDISRAVQALWRSKAFRGY